jgi:hypothetical protein
MQALEGGIERHTLEKGGYTFRVVRQACSAKSHLPRVRVEFVINSPVTTLCRVDQDVSAGPHRPIEPPIAVLNVV